MKKLFDTIETALAAAYKQAQKDNHMVAIMQAGDEKLCLHTKADGDKLDRSRLVYRVDVDGSYYNA